jgi:hypothetical protein
VCSVCKHGYWGKECKDYCGGSCAICEITTGECLACTAGRWGTNCENECGNCVSKKCSKTDGSCQGCQYGFEGENCTSSSEAKNTTNTGMFKVIIKLQDSIFLINFQHEHN